MYVGNLVKSIFDRKTSCQDFSNLVDEIWKSGEFVFFYENIENLHKDVVNLSFDKLITEHGRVDDQSMSVSQHLFGDEKSVAARLVYDPPNRDSDLCIEYHTHPVDSLVVVLSGLGVYSLLRGDCNTIIDVPLEGGTCIFFPSGTVHTIKKIGAQGLETLNITHRLNQPDYRAEVDHTKKHLLLKPSDGFSEACALKSVEIVLYENFLADRQR